MTSQTERIPKVIDAEYVEDLCKWVDGFQLTRVKKDLNRDFSDCCLVSEIIAQYHPSYVELHNYVSCNETKLKINNWNTLRQKVLKKIGLKLSNVDIDNLANWRTNAIEVFLGRLKENLENKKQGTTNLLNAINLFEPEKEANNIDPGKLIATLGEEYKTFLMNGQKENIIDREIVHENEDLKEVFGYYEKIKELEEKMNKLKFTLKSKDKEIQELEQHISQNK